MRAYTPVSIAHQQDVDVELLTEDMVISSKRDAETFLTEIHRRQRLTFDQLRKAVCQDYDLGFVDAEATLKRLEEQQLFGKPEDFLRIFCAGVRAVEKEEAA